MFNVPVSHNVPNTQCTSKTGFVQATIMAHAANQHCGSGDVELEYATATYPCTYIARVYQPDPPAMHRELKDVCDHLEHLDPS